MQRKAAKVTRGGERLALDASALTYLVDGAAVDESALHNVWMPSVAEPDGQSYGIPHARLECRLKPLRANNRALLDEYEEVFEADDGGWDGRGRPFST